jgi:ribonuclease-3
VTKDLTSLEKKLNLVFKNKELLHEALTHRSYLNENPSWPLSNNERLEFLGDAVLELVITELLFEKYPKYQEGELTSFRSALVNYRMLSEIARGISLEEFLYLSRGEAKDSGKAKDVILANAMEAIFGAVYLDQGYDAAKKVIASLVFSKITEVIEKKLYRDSKSLLQELIQEKTKITPTYRVLKETGPDHQKHFVVGVYLGSNQIGEGSGSSKQEAEVNAASQALKQWVANNL